MRWSHFVISKGEHSALQIRSLVAVICSRLKPLKVLDLSTNHDRVDYYSFIMIWVLELLILKVEKQSLISGKDFSSLLPLLFSILEIGM